MSVGRWAKIPADSQQHCHQRGDDGSPSFQYPYDPSIDSTTPYILYVHGWNMQTWEKDRFAESAYKRLYWQGYQGRFGIFRWPTGYGFADIWTLATNPTEKDNYDLSEYQAWQSATGLLNKLTALNIQYPGQVYMLAHSMGNVVAGEALRLAGTTHVVNTYVTSQAAISAHTYDLTRMMLQLFILLIRLGRRPPKRPIFMVIGLRPTTAMELGRSSVSTTSMIMRWLAVAWQLDQLLKPDQDLCWR